MHPRRLIMEINYVINEISDNFYSDYKAVRSNLTELFFQTLMNKLKITIFNFKKNFQHWIFADFGYVILRSPSNLCCKFHHEISRYWFHDDDESRVLCEKSLFHNLKSEVYFTFSDNIFKISKLCLFRIFTCFDNFSKPQRQRCLFHLFRYFDPGSQSLIKIDSTLYKLRSD